MCLQLSSPQPSQIQSGKGPVRKLLGGIRNISVRGAGCSPNPAPVGSSSNARNPIPDHILQAGVILTLRMHCIWPLFLQERLVDAQKATAGVKDISGNVRAAASATNDVQSGCDAVGAVSSTVESLLQPLRVFNSIADGIAKVIWFISTMYVADLCT